MSQAHRRGLAACTPLVAALLIGSGAVGAQAAGVFRHEAQLSAFDAAANDLFGYSVAVSGDTLLVGAENDDATAGAVYVFVRSGTTWTLQQKLTASDAAALQGFGYSVALDGDTALVGARYDDNANGGDAGAAYVFVRSGTAWTEQQKLVGLDTGLFDEFGAAVALDGDTAVVGAHLPNDGALGAAYVFVRSGTTWTEQQKLTASDAAQIDWFGLAVAVDGDTVVVGANREDNASGNDAGSAYVFVRSAGVWTEQQKLLAADGADNARLGGSVSVSGDTALVGAWGASGAAGAASGAVYVFVRSSGTWTQQQKLEASDAEAGDHLGAAVALSGDVAVLGADFGGPGVGPGAAYLFVRSGTLWAEQQKLVAPGGTAGDHLGLTVALSGDSVACGAHADDTAAGLDAGSAHVFRLAAKGDLDLDGHTDLLLRLNTTGQNDAWLMDGVTRPGAPVTIVPAAPSLDWVIAAADDFDADHDSDLLFWNAVTGAADFWLMSGTTRVGAPLALTGALPPPWKPSAAADFDHDGRPDLVYRNYTTQKIEIWTLSGTSHAGTLVPTPDQAVNANWEIVGAQDWSGDGHTDFLWYNPNSGKIVLWFMDGSVVRQTGLFTNPANPGNNNWKVLAMGDYGVGSSGLPGTIDIVWRNLSSGKFVVWYMDRAGNRTEGVFTSPDAPSPNALDWTIVGPR